MKIAILSMQRIVNYGSVLQAYSLKQMIEKAVEAEVKFIDIDRTNSIQCKRKITGHEEYELPEIVNRSFLQRVKWKLVRMAGKKTKYYIEKFMVQELQLEDNNNNDTYDCVVVGSDEVFNTNNGLSLQLFGNIKQARKKISYAASCGSASYEEIPSEDVDKVCEALNNYSIISVRDEGTKKFIERLYNGQIVKNLDPVLMGNLYKREHKKVLLKKYMVIYAYGQRIRSEKEIRDIKKFAKDNHLKTVAIGGTQRWCDYYIPMSPLRVLDYFYYAEYIITDTFHGTIFSVINQKKFVSLIRVSNANKLENLLKDLKLEERGIYNTDCLEEKIKKDIDYNIVNEILDKERIKAKEYLKNNLFE